MISPLFTVIIPTYGRPRYLMDAVRSVLDQTVGDFECIVVDDASPEPATAETDPRVLVVRRERNGGPAAARNTGLHVARGRYVTFLDDDDTYTPNRLALALEGLARAPVTICWRRDSNGSNGGNRSLEGNVWETILDQLTPHLGQVAIDRRLTPVFDERFVANEDVDWWLRVAKVAHVTTVPRIGLVYRVHSAERHLNAPADRIRCGLMLLDVHTAFFRAHPRAEAFRWKRMGLMAMNLGEGAVARRAFMRSMRIRPEARTLWHLTRALARPSDGRTDLLEAAGGQSR